VISLRSIHEIVRSYPSNFKPARVEFLESADGMSGAQFWRLETDSATFMLRRWPSEHPTAERLRFIHEVLFHAERRGISFLAVPVKTTTGESFVSADGRLWELSPWMPGTADFERSPSRQKLAAALTALAKFHLAVSDFLPRASQRAATPPPAVSRRLSRLRELADRGTDELRSPAILADWPELAPFARRFFSTLPRLLPLAIGQLEPLAGVLLPVLPSIRDIWHDHVLFTGDEVSGIIDFGAVDIDTPAADVARLLGSLVGDDAAGWQAGLNAYSTYRPLTADEQQTVRALDISSTVLAGYNWLKWIGVDRRQFEDRGQIVARFEKIVARAEFAAAY
jgi:homoserine kinase type II